MIPIIVGRISIVDEVRHRINNSTNPDIEIAGIPTRNESLAAVFLSIPENKADVNVTPDLETPGNIANTCEIPSKIISLISISMNNFFFLPQISETANNKDIIIEVIAMEYKLLKFEPEKPGQNNLINRPTISIGILAINI